LALGIPPLSAVHLAHSGHDEAQLEQALEIDSAIAPQHAFHPTPII
jgi:hypothetical protein